MTNEEIKKYMKKNKITYRKLAEKLHISYGYLHDMLNGRRNIGNYKNKIERIFKGEYDEQRRENQVLDDYIKYRLFI